MSIVRDMGPTLNAMKEIQLITCSTGVQTLASTVDALQSTTFAATGNAGRIIDRLGDMILKTRYQVAMPAAQIYATRGSTETDRKLTLSIKLQHGDSSGGGDMADYSTGTHYEADQSFFTTAQTTPMASWSTGPFYGQTNPAYYDLRAAKRFIRSVVFASKDKVTTESSGDEGARVSASIQLLGGDFPVPQSGASWTGAGSTSTSTST